MSDPGAEPRVAQSIRSVPGAYRACGRLCEEKGSGVWVLPDIAPVFREVDRRNGCDRLKSPQESEEE
jgi:hypothetical protein